MFKRSVWFSAVHNTYPCVYRYMYICSIYNACLYSIFGIIRRDRSKFVWSKTNTYCYGPYFCNAHLQDKIRTQSVAIYTTIRLCRSWKVKRNEKCYRLIYMEPSMMPAKTNTNTYPVTQNSFQLALERLINTSHPFLIIPNKRGLPEKKPLQTISQSSSHH